MASRYTYEERTIKHDGVPVAFLSREREGPNLPRQIALLGPAELDRLGEKIAAALDLVALLDRIGDMR